MTPSNQAAILLPGIAGTEKGTDQFLEKNWSVPFFEKGGCGAVFS
jgi:hypothetical protein